MNLLVRIMDQKPDRNRAGGTWLTGHMILDIKGNRGCRNTALPKLSPTENPSWGRGVDHKFLEEKAIWQVQQLACVFQPLVKHQGPSQHRRGWQGEGDGLIFSIDAASIACYFKVLKEGEGTNEVENLGWEEGWRNHTETGQLVRCCGRRPEGSSAGANWQMLYHPAHPIVQCWWTIKPNLCLPYLQGRWLLCKQCIESGCNVCWAGHGILTNILGYSIPYLRGECLSCLMVGAEEQEWLIYYDCIGCIYIHAA